MILKLKLNRKRTFSSRIKPEHESKIVKWLEPFHDNKLEIVFLSKKAYKATIKRLKKLLV